MRALVVVSLAAAQTLQTTLDGALGYPLTPDGDDEHGTGRHVTFNAARTLHAVPVFGHPDGVQVCVLMTPATEALLSPAQQLLVVELDASWTTPPGQ